MRNLRLSHLLVLSMSPSVLFEDHTQQKMYFILRYFLPFFLSPVSAVFANPVFPSDSLSSNTATSVTQTWAIHKSNQIKDCVSPAQHPDWAGAIDSTDCKAALFILDIEVSRYGAKYFNFWSGQYQSSPPPSGWKLPYGKSSGEAFPQNPSTSAILPLINPLYLIQPVASSSFAFQKTLEMMCCRSWDHKSTL